MGVPKRRQSKAKVRARRAQWRKIDSLPLVECPQCRQLKVPHRMCAECGFYKKNAAGAEKA
ncbi:50S ribosomal protein L32 [Desulfitibacter alkalitolerans]|uniref:50S ribosomal protein L32 n=1 Tax=Desulfitibacter alkalitolerans TaxID=264641 RepID=UPI000480A3BB|nr:50S ribosomal protein L32 [Desulfitibacter alkalitolerans]